MAGWIIGIVGSTCIHIGLAVPAVQCVGMEGCARNSPATLILIKLSDGAAVVRREGGC